MPFPPPSADKRAGLGDTAAAAGIISAARKPTVSRQCLPGRGAWTRPFARPGQPSVDRSRPGFTNDRGSPKRTPPRSPRRACARWRQRCAERARQPMTHAAPVALPGLRAAGTPAGPVLDRCSAAAVWRSRIVARLQRRLRPGGRRGAARSRLRTARRGACSQPCGRVLAFGTARASQRPPAPVRISPRKNEASVKD